MLIICMVVHVTARARSGRRAKHRRKQHAPPSVQEREREVQEGGDLGAVTMADNRLKSKSSRAGASHLGAITANLLEDERAALVVNNDLEMLEANAALEAEGESREKLETLRLQLKQKRARMKMLQETVVAASTALTNRQRMIEEMGGRLGTLTLELTDRGAFDLVTKGTSARKSHDVEQIALYESRFKDTIDYVMVRALDKSVAARTDAALGKRATDESTLPHVCAVLYCPDGEPKHEAVDEFAVRVTNNMTFRDLRINAAR